MLVSPTRLDDLLGRADVVLYGPACGRHGEVAARGDDALALTVLDRIRSRRPDLITGRVTAYGPVGPLAYRSVDPEIMVAARAGLAGAQSGWLPGPSGFRFPLLSANAALLLVIGVLAALIRRGNTALGAHIETSLLAGALVTMTETMVDGPGIDVERRLDALSRRASGVLPFYGAYECADGRWVHLGCSYPHFVLRAVQALRLERLVPGLLDDEGFDAGRISSPALRDGLYPLIAQVIAQEPSTHWLAEFEVNDVPAALVQSPAEFLDDPQAAVNGRYDGTDSDGRRIEQIGPAIRFRDPPLKVGSNLADRDGRRSEEYTSFLSGVCVLELGNLIAGPLATRILSDLGAEVLKLEPVNGGDLTRANGIPAFHPLNAGKRGIAVDLKTPQGHEIVRALVGSDRRRGGEYEARSDGSPGPRRCIAPRHQP